MSFNFKISQVRDFMNKEKVYMLMLCFILLFNAWSIFVQDNPELEGSLVEEKASELGSEKTATQGEAGQEGYEDVSWSEIMEKGIDVPLLINVLGLGAILVFFLGLYLDIRILMAKIKKRKIFQTAGEHLRINWGLGDIFKLAIIFVFLGHILNIIQLSFSPVASGEKNAVDFIPLFNTGILDLLLLGFVVYFVKVKYSQSLAAIGIKIKGTIRNIFLAVLSYIAFLPLLVFLLLILVWLAAMFDYQPPQQALFKFFLVEQRTWLLVYSTMMVVFFGPVVEEVFFRGFAYNAIKKRWGSSWAMVLTAVVFAGLHGNIIGFLPIMALGVLLAYLYERTGSLTSSITIHILHNTLMVTLLFLARYFIQLVQSV